MCLLEAVARTRAATRTLEQDKCDMRSVHNLKILHNTHQGLEQLSSNICWTLQDSEQWLSVFDYRDASGRQEDLGDDQRVMKPQKIRNHFVEPQRCSAPSFNVFLFFQWQHLKPGTVCHQRQEPPTRCCNFSERQKYISSVLNIILRLIGSSWMLRFTIC